MRLSSIKLAGFKSFVDPTYFQVPGQLVGVVGPNGCGKSNIIDAVRWVLGESRASELRGESMQDVIFNGSITRKSGSRASVELIFDNSEGRAAGQWGQYGEIAVKRVLTRDGTSSYYINNLPARRRDIQDIFLGTGLGPRAYAIIGQGMIARMIEAKPEELRVFLEEAAGVSKYKERRRETENRLHETRENLMRVEDIVREFGANLAKLEAQAVVATKHKALLADGEEKQHLLWLLRKSDAQGEQQKQQRAIEQAQIDLDAQTAKLREVEAHLETLRMAHYAASDAMQSAQVSLYETNAKVIRLEAEIKFIVESRNRMQAQIAALAVQREQSQAQAQKVQDDLEEAEEANAMADARAAIAEDEAAAKHDALPTLESRWRDAQAQLNDERDRISQTEQSLKLEAAHQRNADQQLMQLQQRQERLESEAVVLNAPEEAQLEEQRMQLAEQEEILHDTQAHLVDAQEMLSRLDAQCRAAQERVQAENAQIHQLDARLAALKQLQENVQNEGKIQAWLNKHELGAQPLLWKKLRVEPGWENALEAVLRERLAALEISNLDWVKAFATEAPPAKLAFFSPPPAGEPLVATPVSVRAVLSLVRIDDAGLRAVLNDWLGSVFVADDLAQALATRAQLPVGGTYVVKAGHLVTRLGVQLYALDSEQAGMLARQQEIENLAHQVRAQALLADGAKTASLRTEASYTQAAQALGEVRAQAGRAQQRVHALQMEMLKLAQAHEHYTQRSTQIREELAEIVAQIDQQRALRAESEANFERYDSELAKLQVKFKDNQLTFETLDEELSNARQQASDLERVANAARYAAHNSANRIDELKRSIQAAHDQSERVTASLEDARAELEAINEQTAYIRLQAALEMRSAKDQMLGAARLELDDLAAKLRVLEESRLAAERAQQPLRDRITELQLKEQAARLSTEQFSEQLAAVGVDEAALLPKLTPELRPTYLQGEVTRINNAIAALGPVNMAAFEELAVASERKIFLNAQSVDLLAAITTLEEAIRKIDQETRTLLQATFAQVNHHFSALFPKLFGGGQAKLLMTGDEILDAGVQVMAQPPGKKNATIHLLSGGEKALTATALVFAMFQLNPAPFCLLDEVDAPLDDANTERFVNLVRAMSSKTQFLFISHNKIAMEMAQQLIGVTMQEQGVSRIVGVDIETAAGFA
ncbi:MAG: chromosome segregation protein SMC [Burkholderia sp.]|nr:MAG: Chromosome partition protein Smc [Burkholderia gladioli]